LKPGNEYPLALRFLPEDPASRPIVSYNNQTNNLLLKVIVPKRTGRKRKRGSKDEFTPDTAEISAKKDAELLLRSLKDNPHRYHAEVVGSIQSAHVWRSMPDFGYSSRGSTFLNEVKSKIVAQDYPPLKQWSYPRDPTSASADSETIPPPVFSTLALPYNFSWQGAPYKRPVKKQATREAETLGDLALDGVAGSHVDDGPNEVPSESHTSPSSTEG